MSLKRVAIPSPNYSSRGGSKVRLIVLHTAEGAKTYQDLGAYFATSRAGVSSHVGIDDTPGTIGEYVQRSGKAWTSANANPVAVQVELCAWANWKAADWNKHSQMLDNCAKWIAEEAKAFGLPITKLNAQQAQSNGRGVCQHVDLGQWGGSHWDCGNHFPIDDVLDIARGSASKPPSTKTPPLHVDYFSQSHNATCPDVRTWQQQMAYRHWKLDADGIYGPQSEKCCRQFQSNKGLSVDGQVGPQTWKATWEAPIT